MRIVFVVYASATGTNGNRIVQQNGIRQTVIFPYRIPHLDAKINAVIWQLHCIAMLLTILVGDKEFGIIHLSCATACPDSAITRSRQAAGIARNIQSHRKDYLCHSTLKGRVQQS